MADPATERVPPARQQKYVDEAVKAGMTPAEAEAWEAVRVAAVACLRLTEDEMHHPMEREEMCHAFHVIQGWLGGRPFLRSLRESEANAT